MKLVYCEPRDSHNITINAATITGITMKEDSSGYYENNVFIAGNYWVIRIYTDDEGGAKFYSCKNKEEASKVYHRLLLALSSGNENAILSPVSFREFSDDFYENYFLKEFEPSLVYCGRDL